MPPFMIVPLDSVRLETLFGHNERYQVAVTDIGEKPEGDHWEPMPAVCLNVGDPPVQLVWRRPLAIDLHNDDTQPVPVDAWAQK